MVLLVYRSRMVEINYVASDLHVKSGMEGVVALSLAIRGGRAFTCYTADEVSRAKRRQLCFQQPCATKRPTTSTIPLLHHWDKYTLATPQTTPHEASFARYDKTILPLRKPHQHADSLRASFPSAHAIR
jgi:hypothetical protein